MNCTKKFDNQAKETPYFSDTHDLLRYLLSKKNIHILDVQIQGVRTLNECVKWGKGSHAYNVWSFYDTIINIYKIKLE